MGVNMVQARRARLACVVFNLEDLRLKPIVSPTANLCIQIDTNIGKFLCHANSLFLMCNGSITRLKPSHTECTAKEPTNASDLRAECCKTSSWQWSSWEFALFIGIAMRPSCSELFCIDVCEDSEVLLNVSFWPLFGWQEDSIPPNTTRSNSVVGLFSN